MNLSLAVLRSSIKKECGFDTNHTDTPKDDTKN